MAEATAAVAANPGMDRYNRYYNAVLAQLQGDAGPERSDSQLKNYLVNMIRPTYQQAILQRQNQTGQANAAIDTDAASRGMGTSTWVTDAKNRQRQNEAADIATLNSNYNTTLYDSLLGLINQRDQNRLSLMGQAQSIAGNMYDRWKAEDDALAKGSGSGGGGEGGSGGRGRGGSGKGDGLGDVDDAYGTNRNPLTKTDGLTEEYGKYKPNTGTPASAGQMTQLQRERVGLDDKANGQYTNKRSTQTIPDPVNQLKSKKIPGVGLTLTTTRR